MDKPLVSIVVACDNMAEYVEDCLESLIKQTYLNLEIIIVDNNSIDPSLDIAKTVMENNDIDYQIITNSNAIGLGACRNLGIDKSNGEYILFIDADDRFGPNLLLELITQLDSLPMVDIAFFDGRNFRDQNHFMRSRNYKVLARPLKVITGTTFFKDHGNLNNCSQKIYRKEFLQKNEITFLPEASKTSLLFWIHVCLAAKRMCYIPFEGYQKRVRMDIIMYGYSAKSILDKMNEARVMATYLDTLKDEKIRTIFYKPFNQYIFDLKHDCLDCKDDVDMLEIFRSEGVVDLYNKKYFSLGEWINYFTVGK